MENILDQESQGSIANVALTNLKEKLEFVQYLFMDDIIVTKQGCYISFIPFMEHRCLAIIIERFNDGEKINSTCPRGTCMQLGSFVEKFTSVYAEAIHPENTIEENLNALIWDDKKDKKGINVWYFRMCLERLTNPDFVDLRPEFHRLYNEYQTQKDHEAALIKIDEAVEKYK